MKENVPLEVLGRQHIDPHTKSFFTQTYSLLIKKYILDPFTPKYDLKESL